MNINQHVQHILKLLDTIFARWEAMWIWAKNNNNSEK